jgi:hypothetical protein
MLAWIIALILFVCLIAVILLHFKAIRALNNRYEAVLYEAKTRSSFAEEAWTEARWRSGKGAT